MRLALELALARSAGRLSRLAGRGGGTTIPGKILATIDPGSVSTLAARLPRGTAAISATNGKTTTAALVAAIVGKSVRLAHNGSGANLVSGVASTLIEARDAELGLFEVDEGAFPEVARRIRPRAVCLGNLFRDQLDRYGELEQIAERWRAAVAELPDQTALVVNADDPQVGDLVRPGTGHLRHRRSRAGAADAPARIRLEVLPALRDAVRLRSRLRRASGRLPLPCLRSCTTPARCRGARNRAARARGGLIRPRHPGGHPPRTARPAGALQRLQRARGRFALARARRHPRRDRRGAGVGTAGVRPRRADRRRLPAAAPPADQEPSGRERGGADGRRSRGAAARGGGAERRDRRRARRLLDLGRRLRALARVPGARRRLRRAARPSSPSASPTRVFRPMRSRSSRSSAQPSTAGSS